MTREDFFTALENGAKWDIGVAINRTNPVPIDANSVFKTLSDLQTYAETNPVAHPGQVVAVVDESETAAYIINTTGSGAQVSKLAASTAGDIGEAVSQLQTQVANIISGSQIVGEATKAEQDADGNVISETYATKEVATTEAAGLMSAADKSKLDGIAAGAEANVVEGVSVKSTTEGDFTPVSIVGKVAQIDLSQIDTDITSLEGRMDTAESNISTLQTQVEGLTGAMHFVGTSTTDPTTDGPTIATHEGDYQAGDVCLYDGKEYIYDGTSWREFGNEGDHLTKEQADTYYVPKERTVNGKALTGNITLSAGDVGADAAGTAAAAIQALDVEAVEVGASETIASISETDGKIAATKQSIKIAISQVTDLQAELDSKLEEGDIPESFDITATSNDFTASGGANSVTINLTQSASSVSGKLTKNLEGTKLDFGGSISANGVTLTANEGTVTSITAGEGLTTGGSPITGAGTISLEATGAAEQSTSNSGRNYVQNITVDDYGRVTAISSAEVPKSTDTVRQIKVDGTELLDTTPGTALDIVAGKNITLTPNAEDGSITIAAADAPVYTGESGVVSVADNTISLEAGGVGTEKIADSAVTDAKISSVNINKIIQDEGDILILNGGKA